MNKVYIKRDFTASISKVFSALTDPGMVIQWFGPKNTQTIDTLIDLKVGGNYQYEIERPDKTTFFIEGEFLEISVPNRIVYTSQYRNLPGAEKSKSVITMNLEQLTTGTHLEFIQEFEVIPENMANRSESWELMFDRVDSCAEMV